MCSVSKKICIRASPDKDSRGRRRDDIERLGDDLIGVMLSYLPLSDKYRLLFVSSMFMNNMFSYSNFVSLTNILFAPQYEWNLALYKPKTYDSLIEFVDREQFRRINKLYARLDYNCLPSVALYAQKCLNIRSLKIEGGNRKVYFFADWSNIIYHITPLSKIKELYLGICVLFSTESLLDYFIHKLSPILREVGINLGNNCEIDINLIINKLDKFPHLTTLSICYLNNHITICKPMLENISKKLPNLQRLIIYRQSDRDEPILFDILYLQKLFKNMDYYYVGPMMCGHWGDSSFAKWIMCDMHKFGQLRKPIQLMEPYTTLYYSRKHHFIYYVQRLLNHRLKIPDGVTNLVFLYQGYEYNAMEDSKAVIRILKEHQNISHIRLRGTCFTHHLQKYLIKLAKMSNYRKYCFSTRDPTPLETLRNIQTNYYDLKYMIH